MESRKVNMVPSTNEDGSTVEVAGVIHQDTDPEMGKVPDLEGYHQRERRGLRRQAR